MVTFSGGCLGGAWKKERNDFTTHSAHLMYKQSEMSCEIYVDVKKFSAIDISDVIRACHMYFTVFCSLVHS